MINADWGTEFLGKFSRYCRDAGIRIRRSEPYTPWRNGQVEVYNRKLKTTRIDHQEALELRLRVQAETCRGFNAGA